MGPIGDENTTQEKLGSEQNLLNKLGITHKRVLNGTRMNGGRGAGNKNLPEFAKSLIAISAQGETAKEVAAAYGVSERTAKNLKQGKVGGTSKAHVDPSLKEKIDNFKERVQDVALAKLMESVGLVDSTDVKDPEKQSKIAVNLAGVVSKLDKKVDDKGNSIQAGVFIYAPGSRDESEYPVIPVDPIN